MKNPVPEYLFFEGTGSAVVPGTMTVLLPAVVSGSSPGSSGRAASC